MRSSWSRFEHCSESLIYPIGSHICSLFAPIHKNSWPNMKLGQVGVSHLAPKREWKIIRWISFCRHFCPMGDCGGGGGLCTVRQIRRGITVAHTIMKCTYTLVGSIPIINNVIIGAVYKCSVAGLRRRARHSRLSAALADRRRRSLTYIYAW